MLIVETMSIKKDTVGPFIETGALIVNAFASLSYTDIPMVLVAGHGPFCWGDSPEKALYHSQMIEELATTAFLTLKN